jgi:hypothetical protein
MARSLMRFLSRYEWAGLAFILLYALPVAFIRTLEGAVFPVVSNTRIASIRGEAGATVITAVSHRNRRCKWVATEWYLGQPDQPSEPLQVNYDVRPKPVEFGPVTVEAVIVGADPRSIINSSYAVARYECWPWPFTGNETQTLFYLGNGKDVGLLMSDAKSNEPSLTNGDGHTVGGAP